MHTSFNLETAAGRARARPNGLRWIEMSADAVDIGKTIHPHPTLGESTAKAAEVAHGSCTDVPQQKK